MKRVIVAVLLCALVGPPAWAQEIRSLNLQAIVQQKGIEIAAYQVPQVPQTPPPATTTSSGSGDNKAKYLYIATLAGAVVGTIYNIKTTREALDLRLRARTFPLVWKETNKPEDKGQVSAIIAGANGGLLAVGALVYRNDNKPLATFINVLVGAGTGLIGLKNRNTINNCKKPGVVCT
jgi:hypothetical protein